MRSWYILVFFAGSFLSAADEDTALVRIRTMPEDTNKAAAYTKYSVDLRKAGDLRKAKDVARQGLELSLRLKWEKGEASSYGALGVAEFHLGNYAAGLEWQYKALKLREKLGDLQGKSAAYTNLGLNYHGMEKYEEAMRCLDSSMAIKKRIGDKKGLIAVHNNRGMVFQGMGEEVLGLHEYEEALKLSLELKDRAGESYAYNNLGNSYAKLGRFTQALENFKASLEIKRIMGDLGLIGACYNNIGRVYLEYGKLELGRQFLDSGLQSALRTGNKDLIMGSYRGLAEADSLLGNMKDALSELKLYAIYKDSVVNEDNRKKAFASQMEYEFGKKEAAARAEQLRKDAVALTEKERQEFILYLSLAALLLSGILLLLVYRSYRQYRYKNSVITLQKRFLEQKQEEIMGSIHYARRIQRSLLPSESFILKCFQRMMRS